jgi:hypothetical protein
MEKDFFRNCLKNFRKSSMCDLIFSVGGTVVDETVTVGEFSAVGGGWTEEEAVMRPFLRFFFFFIEFFMVLTTF